MAKIEVTQQEVNFKPIKIEITLETQQEFDTIYALCNASSGNISDAVDDPNFDDDFWLKISAVLLKNLDAKTH